MEDRQKLQMIDEIRKIERELYLKKSQLAAAEAREYGVIRVGWQFTPGDSRNEIDALRTKFLYKVRVTEIRVQ